MPSGVLVGRSVVCLFACSLSRSYLLAALFVFACFVFIGLVGLFVCLFGWFLCVFAFCMFVACIGKQAGRAGTQAGSRQAGKGFKFSNYCFQIKQNSPC